MALFVQIVQQKLHKYTFAELLIIGLLLGPVAALVNAVLCVLLVTIILLIWFYRDCRAVARKIMATIRHPNAI